VTSVNTPPQSGRRTVCVKLSWAGVAELDRMATDEGVDRSALIRTLLAEAIQARRQRPT
jgi:metal-responsive CopG/Arc/MetJ family transcriptional regulator